MRVLYIQTYATWKSIVQTRGFSVFHKVVDTEVRKAWCGTPELIYHVDVTSVDWADWNTNFEGTSTEVPSEDDALANITGLGQTLIPRAPDGTPQFATQSLTLGQEPLTRHDNNSEQMNINGSSTGTSVAVWDGEGTYWTPSGVGSVSGAAAQEGTNGWDTGVTAENDNTFFNNGSMIDVAGTYDTVQFWLNPKAVPAGSRPRIAFVDDSNNVVGSQLRVDNYTTNMDLDTWQHVSIPITDFGLTGNAQKIRFRQSNVAGQHYWWDKIELVPPGGGPYRFVLEAPDNKTLYHITMIVLIVAGSEAGWDSGKFGNIAALENGLLLRLRNKIDSEVLWKFNSKDNVDLFGRFHPQDDITFANGELLVGFMIKPGAASVVVTDTEVLEFVVRDDLSGLGEARAYAHFGVEKIP